MKEPDSARGWTLVFLLGPCEGRLVYFDGRHTIGACRREIRSAHGGVGRNIRKDLSMNF